LWIGGVAATIALVLALALWRWEVDEAGLRLEPVSFSEIEGWTEDDHAAAFAALRKMCRKRSASNAACADALRLGEAIGREVARRFFETHYVPHRVDEAEPGLVTGYYEPEVSGSRVRGGKFQVPVYRRPDDLVQVTPDELRAFYNAGFSVGRQNGGELVPYYTRAEIEAGALDGKGLELL
jgi:membrane-bound lytic murein transglycosylase A